MAGCRLHLLTFLAPNLYPVYRFLARYLGRRLGCRTELAVGTSYAQLAGEADVAFVCGLPYVKLACGREPPVEPLAAPVLAGPRYGGQPIYFSDVIVRRTSSFQSFADLRGCCWCYNEPHSQSGYGIVRYHLAQLGETDGYFGRVVQAGFHQRAIRWVCSGAADAAAIDSQVLAVAQRNHPGLAARLRVIASLGPSTIQPIVAARRLSADLRAALRAALVELPTSTGDRAELARGFVERFVPVSDADYDGIREMLAATGAAELSTPREARCPLTGQASPAGEGPCSGVRQNGTGLVQAERQPVLTSGGAQCQVALGSGTLALSSTPVQKTPC